MTYMEKRLTSGWSTPYNTQRPHQSLEYQTPEGLYKKSLPGCRPNRDAGTSLDLKVQSPTSLQALSLNHNKRSQISLI